MNEEFFEHIFNELGYAQKGATIEQFKNDFSNSEEFQNYVFNELGYSNKGVTFEQFQQDLGFEPTYQTEQFNEDIYQNDDHYIEINDDLGTVIKGNYDYSSGHPLILGFFAFLFFALLAKLIPFFRKKWVKVVLILLIAPASLFFFFWLLYTSGYSSNDLPKEAGFGAAILSFASYIGLSVFSDEKRTKSKQQINKTTNQTVSNSIDDTGKKTNFEIENSNSINGMLKTSIQFIASIFGLILLFKGAFSFIEKVARYELLQNTYLLGDDAFMINVGSAMFGHILSALLGFFLVYKFGYKPLKSGKQTTSNSISDVVEKETKFEMSGKKLNLGFVETKKTEPKRSITQKIVHFLRYNRLAKVTQNFEEGWQRVFMVLSLVLPLLFSVFFEIYLEEGVGELIVLFPIFYVVYWLVVAIIIWIYEGFDVANVEEDKNNSIEN